MGIAKVRLVVGDKVLVIATGEVLSVVASTPYGVYAWHKSPFNKPHKDAIFFPYREIENVSTT